jgi:hypothetical protein
MTSDHRVAGSSPAECKVSTRADRLATAARVLSKTSFGEGAGSKLKAVKQLPFEVTVNRLVTQAPAKQWRLHGLLHRCGCFRHSPEAPIAK